MCGTNPSRFILVVRKSKIPPWGSVTFSGTTHCQRLHSKYPTKLMCYLTMEKASAQAENPSLVSTWGVGGGGLEFQPRWKFAMSSPPQKIVIPFNLKGFWLITQECKIDYKLQKDDRFYRCSVINKLPHSWQETTWFKPIILFYFFSNTSCAPLISYDM